ncbi:MAG: PD40 domain-containing protein [Chloroflexi bacterium]|nr:PD40 domain-containing protein [Chloroflexota bacterium]
MAGLNAAITHRFGNLAMILAMFLTLALVLGACGEQPTAVPPPVTSATNIQNPPPTATLAPTITPAPTATSDVPLAFTSPAATPPPIFPTATAAPSVKGPNFTATAGVPDLNLTPLPTTSAATGQLAFVQAGNLWLIDSNGGNRLQLTDSGDVASDSLMLWTSTFDRVVYQARTGELWTVDTTGERNLVFAPGKTAKLGSTANLPPLPTQTAGKNATNPNRTPVNPAIQTGKTITDLSWSPDGHFLAFTYYNGDQGPLNSGEVWVAEIISGKPALARVGEGFSPTWGPDSRSLAFLTRPTIKQGSNLPGYNPGLNPTPVGTSLLPPTVSFTRSAGEDAGIFQVGQGTPNPADTTPASGGTATTELTPVPGSPTPFILKPGGNTTPNPGNPTNQATNRATTPTPTATSNLVALPSPTPTPTYPPVYKGTFLANQVAVYSVFDHKVTLLADSDKIPDAFLDLTGTLRSYVPAPFQAAWFSPDGRFVAFSDALSVVGVIPVGGGAPITWTGSPQNYAVHDLDWLPRSDGAFVRWGDPYSADSSRLSLITFNNPGPTAGNSISGDVTNPKLVKISDLPGQKVSCAKLSPGGQFFSYYDGNTLVITQSDGSVYQSYSDTECPVWSPFGRDFASIKKTGDHSIILTNLDQPAPKEIISTRAIERVFWLR